MPESPRQRACGPRFSALAIPLALAVALGPATVPDVAAADENPQVESRVKDVIFVFRNTVAGPDEAECGESESGFNASTSVIPEEAAAFTDSVQEMSEATRLGIPALFKSNARNHIAPDARAGINESVGAFTSFPKEAGISLGAEAAASGEDPTTGDMAVVEDFSHVMGQEWRSIGLRGMYGYMAGLSSPWFLWGTVLLVLAGGILLLLRGSRVTDHD